MKDPPEVKFGHADSEKTPDVRRSSEFTVYVNGKPYGRIYRFRLGSWQVDQPLANRLGWTFDDRRGFAREKVGLPAMREMVTRRVIRVWVRRMIRRR